MQGAKRSPAWHVDSRSCATRMAESLRTLAEDLVGHFNQTVLDHHTLTSHKILGAVADLGISLVWDPVSDSTHTYHESFQERPEQQPKPGDA